MTDQIQGEELTVQGKRIHAQIAKVMVDLGAIGKDRKNSQQGYNFRGIDDVYNAVHEVLGKHGVFTVPKVLADRTEERTTGKGTALIYRVLKIRYRFFADDGSFVDAVVIGEGMDSGDKATNKAMSVAHKYALLQVFAIPTEEPKDPEIDSHDVQPAQQANQRFQRREPPPDDLRSRIDQMEEAFHGLGVGMRDILGRLGKKNPKEITADDLGALKSWYKELKQGDAQ